MSLVQRWAWLGKNPISSPRISGSKLSLHEAVPRDAFRCIKEPIRLGLSSVDANKCEAAKLSSAHQELSCQSFMFGSCGYSGHDEQCKRKNLQIFHDLSVTANADEPSRRNGAGLGELLSAIQKLCAHIFVL